MDVCERTAEYAGLNYMICNGVTGLPQGEDIVPLGLIEL